LPPRPRKPERLEPLAAYFTETRDPRVVGGAEVFERQHGRV